MATEQPHEPADAMERAIAAQFALDRDADAVRAWEQVDAGRYMPRRVKGSCKGRALG